MTEDEAADLLAIHALSHIDEAGWTVCLCGHHAVDDDDDGSHARHQAQVLAAAGLLR